MIFCNKKAEDNKARVFYGGSISGDIGGPLVKKRKLKALYPENFRNFNLVYLLSNHSFVSKHSLNLIKKRKIKIILNQNGVYYKSWFKGDYLAKNKEMSYAYHLADYVFWQSKFCRETSDLFLGKRIGDGEILYNSVDTNFFKPRLKNKKFFDFLITGNISRISNYRIISVLKALKELKKSFKNIRLIIAGNIEDRIFLEHKSDQMNLAKYISFIGKFSQSEAPNIYNLADAYITMTYKDNCPTAVLEAMSCGLPILFSSTGGIPELVDKNSGVGLEVSSSWEEIKEPSTKKIISGMISIINNRKSMSDSARLRVLENFDIKYWKKRHEYIFNKLRK